jgi:tRNA (cytidine/uridine-2'-O-)-methyltransferase
LKSKNHFKIVLYAPEIPGNTGTIGRTCVALEIELILIKPLGFDIDQKAVRRAGLDYWKHLQLKVYEDWDHFLEKENPRDDQLFFLSKRPEQTIYDANFCKDAFLVFGSETKGLPQDIFDQYEKRMYSLPMFSDKVRSLNLSNAATAVAYELIRQIG